MPTVAESGFPGFEAVGWLGILVPNGMPPNIIARLNAEFSKVMQSPEVRKALATDQGAIRDDHPGAG